MGGKDERILENSYIFLGSLKRKPNMTSYFSSSRMFQMVFWGCNLYVIFISLFPHLINWESMHKCWKGKQGVIYIQAQINTWAVSVLRMKTSDAYVLTIALKRREKKKQHGSRLTISITVIDSEERSLLGSPRGFKR